MDSRFARAVVSFALVASAYWAYLNVAEPLMARPIADLHAGSMNESEPAVADSSANGINSPPVEPPEAAPSPTERLLSLIAPYFPENSWERTTARVLKNDQFMLLLREFKPTNDGRLHVFPCTLVFQPTGLKNGVKGRGGQRTWIVQAPEGAVLSFDKPIDDRLMNVGRLQAAFIQGRVTIRGSETQPGAADQIELTTQNVQLSEQRIWTPGEVHFRIGPHFGSGRDLTIAMAPVTRGELKRLPTTIPARVRSVELVHLDKLQISVPQNRTIPAGNGRSVTQVTHVPVKIGCDGNLLMEMSRGVAQMKKNVRIVRPLLDATGLEDHLECDQLALYFSRNLIFREDGRDKPPPIEFERLVATGQPAVAYSARQGAGQSDAQYLLESPKFEFGLGAQPEFMAQGAGRLRGLFGEDGQIANLSWQGALSYKEHAQGGLVTVQQQANCAIEGLGQVNAEQIRVGLTKANRLPEGGQQEDAATLQPKNVHAIGRVRIDVGQIKAQVNSLSVAFRQQSLPATNGSLRLNAPQQQTQSATGRRYIVTGDTMQLGVVRDNEKAQIDDLLIDRSVRCVEVVGNNEGRGAELTGDRLELHKIASGAAVGLFSGSPVTIRANRLDLRGRLIRFEQASNRLWIDGAGSAALPLPPSVARRFSSRATVGYLNWQQSLTFDGNEIRADGGVEVRGPSQLIRCDSVLGTLSKPIRMADVSAGAQIDADGIELTNITADGRVFIENRTFDQRGLIAIDSGSMQRININQTTSEFLAIGPGHVKTVRFGINKPNAAGVLGKPTPRGAAPDPQNQLSYLRVQFQRQAAGNMHVRRLIFEDRVQAIYGPVPNWDTELPDDPRALSPDQVSLRCDQLSLVQMLRRGQRSAPFEFRAEGNTLVEGHDYQARAHRLSYDQQKDQIVLEGEGGSDAQIFRESNGKRQSTSARKIQFWPNSNRIEVHGADVIELN